MRTRRLTTLTIGAAIAALIATGCEWHFETLDGAGGPNGRVDANVGPYGTALLHNGRPHAFYYDVAGDLRHAYYTGTVWGFETLDGNHVGPNGRVDDNVGVHNAAVLYNGRPHVFYFNADTQNLRHAYYTGSAWGFETLDGNGGANGRINANVGQHNTAVLYKERPHVFYYDQTAGNLRHAYWNGVFWAFETLDGAGGANGRIAANLGRYGAAMLYHGRPHVFYYDDDNDDLRHAYWNGVFWAFETLDGAGGPNGRINSSVGWDSAAVLYDGRPQVFYRDNTNDDLRHAYYTGTAWGFETLDGAGGPNGRVNAVVGEYSAAVLYAGRPHVFYHDADNGDVRHAYYTGSAWGFETLDGNGGANGRINAYVGRFNVALLYNGRPDVFYYDATNDDLRHAYFG